MDPKISRKDFLKTTALTGAGLSVAPFNILESKNNSRIRIGMIGVGGRGTSHLQGLLRRKDVVIPAVCDVRKKHAERAKNIIIKAGQEAPELYTGGKRVYETKNNSVGSALPIPEQTPKSKNAYKQLIARDDLDAVIIATPWRFHVPIAVDAMKAGKYVGLEVPAAYTVDGCWDLVNASESTGIPCMLLENVCYRRDVLAIQNMIRQGLFGELIHARCGYEHNLLSVMLDQQGNFGPGTTAKNNPHNGESVWRTYHHIERNGDLYPTHGIGPVAHWLDINRGNRFLKLTSTATKARGLHETIEDRAGENSSNADIKFKHGDVVTSTITTANGESIIVTHNTTLPKPYSLGYRCQGTKGLWLYESKNVYLKGKSPHYDEWEPFDSYKQKYDPPLLKKNRKKAAESGHGGIDWYVRNAFVESIKRNVTPPIDVYDAAAWSVIGPLSEESIAKGGAPVDFPDFTEGQWIHNGRTFNVNGEY